MEAVLTVIVMIFLILLWIVAVILQYNLFMKVLKKAHIVVIYMFITLFASWFAGSALVAVVVYVYRFKKYRQKVFTNISTNPNNNSVDELIDYINAWGLENSPAAWGELKAVWNYINKSPNITTENKEKCIQFLTLHGLKLYYKEAEVIDNYGQQTKKATQ